jgi:two-component system, chemotaxis family, protein-glutamate methylesterase/glutaminase
MVRVLIIDDSAVVRKILSTVLSQDPEINVVGAAPDPFVARDMIVQHKPDVLLLDVEMPRMDGITFLRKVMEFKPMPVLIVSSLTTAGSKLALEALAAGAVEVIAKPSAAYSLGDIAPDLIAKTKAAKFAHVRKMQPAKNAAPALHLTAVDTTHKILAIGASTGGTVAIEAVIRQLPTNIPGTVIAQHMPMEFTAAFADRLNSISEIDIREAKAGDVVRPGQILIAPGDQHMVVERSGALYRIGLNRDPKVHRVRPAVDVLFHSVAKNAGRNAIGVVLTGMGVDGAEGLLAMRERGATTIAQDEKTCVVFGMPRAAIECGGAQQVLPLDQIANAIVNASRSSEVRDHARASG